YESGSVITTTTRITANHWGTFLYNLCVLDYKGQPETEECFEKYPLKLAGGQTQYTLRSSSVGDYKLIHGEYAQMAQVLWAVVPRKISEHVLTSPSTNLTQPP
ncbi:hypothetical protein C0J52_20989, partial [Blattella germanica]